jgi:DNA invertase Pin-like site-specific DNA recombinase
MTKAYSYLRFSTPEQMLGDSYRRQTQLALDYAARHGLELDTQLTLKDLGVSAFRGKNARTGALGAFLQAIDADMVPQGSMLLVESLDRVTRQDPWDALPLFQQIINAGVTIVTLQDGKTYSREEMRANPMRILESLFVMIRANEESATKSRRLKAAWVGKRQRAAERVLTARAPYWLRLDATNGKFEVIEERADIVRRIFAMTLDGIGQHRITETLNAERAPVFGNGRHWHRSYIAKLLNNPAVIGTFVPHTVEHDGTRKLRRPDTAVEGYFPAVVDHATFENVQAMMRETRSPLRGRHAMSGTIRNIFGGLARCPLCEGAMTRVSKGEGNGRAYLVCANAKAGGGCRYRSVPYEQLEECFLKDAARVIATAPAGGGGELDEKIDRLEGNIQGAEDAIENIMESIERGRSSLIERQRLRELEGEQEQMEREHDDLLRQRAEVAGPLVSQRLDTLRAALRVHEIDRTHVNVLLRQLFSAAVVDYRSGQLALLWKHGGESDVVFGWPEERDRRLA